MNRALIYLLVIVFIFLSAGVDKAQIVPVANAQITVSLLPNHVFIANCTTDQTGKFTFSISSEMQFPNIGVFEFNIVSSTFLNVETNIINVNYTLPNNHKLPVKFTYFLKFKKDKAQTRGSFAVSGKSDT